MGISPTTSLIVITKPLRVEAIISVSTSKSICLRTSFILERDDSNNLR
ncbi:uncharacterized protein METZ01_LOCUS465399 [marine metagenome]|uniref:Uncharacterized protein n=1 Tax=marine metagenome TaxID=408172 RepID=A0A383AZA1_9ZZZZ